MAEKEKNRMQAVNREQQNKVCCFETWIPDSLKHFYRYDIRSILFILLIYRFFFVQCIFVQNLKFVIAVIKKESWHSLIKPI